VCLLLFASRDAWNRLVKVADGEDTVAEYEYLCPSQLGWLVFSSQRLESDGCLAV
jgi:hypothetical protein